MIGDVITRATARRLLAAAPKLATVAGRGDCGISRAHVVDGPLGCVVPRRGLRGGWAVRVRTRPGAPLETVASFDSHDVARVRLADEVRHIAETINFTIQQKAARAMVTSVRFNSSTGEHEVVEPGFGPSSLAAKDAAPEHNWSGFSMRSTAGGDAVDLSGASFQAAEMPGARNHMGSPVGNRELRDTDVVEVQGMKVRVKEARRLGLIPAGGTGLNPFGDAQRQGDHNGAQSLQDGQDADVAPDHPATEKAPHGPALNVSDETVAAMTAIHDSGISEGSMRAIIREFLDSKDGTISAKGSLGMATAETGLEPGEIIARVAEVHAGVADAVAKRVGIHDQEMFQRWASGSRKPAVEQAVQRALNGDASAFDALGEQWRQQLDMVDPEAVTAALTASKVPHRKGPNGRLIVTAPGHPPMAYPTAVRMGLFRFSLA